MSNNNILVDLLKNGSFLKWLKKEDGANPAHWEKWQQENPENEKTIEEAKMIIKGLPFKKRQISSDEKTARWEELVAKLDSPQSKVTNLSPEMTLYTTRNSQSFDPKWLKIAAAITFLVISCWGVFSYFNQAELINHHTHFAENETIELPDGTVVTLAANSSLSFYDDFKKGNHRKVQLLGEAYFKVAKQPIGKQFIVNLKDLSVKVIGTEFNVNSHRVNSIISLVEGKVALTREGIADQQLKEGQTAVFNINTSKFDLISDQTNYWADWRKQKWSFGEGKPMKEVIQRIEETFGLSVQCEDAEILAKIASGSINIDNQEVLLESLSYLLDVEYELMGNKLILSLKVDSEE